MDIAKRLVLIFLIALLLLAAAILIIHFASAYSTYGAPAEFGNESHTTCWIGGDFGIANCTGNATFDNYRNLSGDLDWIRPENIFDVDDEDIESDLNTYVDVAGDNMTANLTFLGNYTGITIYEDGAVKVKQYWNGSAFIIEVP